MWNLNLKIMCVYVRERMKETLRECISSTRVDKVMEGKSVHRKRRDFLGGSVSGKASPCQCRAHGFDFWSRKNPPCLGTTKLCPTTFEPGSRAQELQP